MNIALKQPKTGDTYEVSPSAAAVELLKICIGQTDGKSEEQDSPIALTLDKESIFAIKFYERDGRALPQTPGDVYTFLGEIESDVEGLTNSDLLTSYLNIKSNADKWAPLEDSMKILSINLDNFASNMISNGDISIDFLDVMLTKYGDLGDVDPDRLEDEEYIKELLEKINGDEEVAEEDANKLKATAALIDNLRKKAVEYHDETEALLASIRGFRDEMKVNADDIAKKEQLCDNLNLDEQLDALKDSRRVLKERIAELETEYDTYVKNALLGLVGGAIGVTITGSIFGPKAKKVRKDIDSKKQELRVIEADINQLSALLNAITNIDGQFEGMLSVMIQAEKGLEDILFVWQTMYEYLENSYNSCLEIEIAESLLLYWVHLITMVDPWRSVQPNAKMVHEIFQQALEEWAEQNAG